MSSSDAQTSTIKNALKAVNRRWQEHHQSVTAAYGIYYGSPVATPSGSAAPSRRASAEAAPSPALSVTAEEPKDERRPSNFSRAWTAVKEHNKSVNNAYAAYYGVHKLA